MRVVFELDTNGFDIGDITSDTTRKVVTNEPALDVCHLALKPLCYLEKKRQFQRVDFAIEIQPLSTTIKN
jgi:hypothetical protein